MKISPESLVADESLCLKYKSIFVSGSDESYILSIVELLVKNLLRAGYVKKTFAETNSMSPDLFKAEKNYVYTSDKYIGNKLVEEIESSKDIIICYEKNSIKNKLTKGFFSKPGHRALVECYELDQQRKKIILNGFVKKNGLILDNDVFWLLLDLLDSSFSILNKELEKVMLLQNINDAHELTNALNPEQLTDANKFFFKMHMGRNKLATFLNSSVNSLSDFYSHFSYFKIYSDMLIMSQNKVELESRIPRYLFKEKQSLVNLFISLNQNKKKLISSLLYKTESLVRKNPDLYKSLFFRFVVNYKKIIS